MTSHKGKSSPTRRLFIKSASLVSAAAMLTLPSKAKADEGMDEYYGYDDSMDDSMDQQQMDYEEMDQYVEVDPVAEGMDEERDDIQTVNLGAVPSPSSYGTVVIPKSNLTFVTFNAIQLDQDGNYNNEGLAVIELTGCKDWRFRMAGNTDSTECEAALEELAECQTYEVQRSSWVEEHETQNSGSGSANKLRHIVITFYGEDGVCEGAQNFEFLAEDMNVQVVDDGNFNDVVDYMSYLDTMAA